MFPTLMHPILLEGVRFGAIWMMNFPTTGAKEPQTLPDHRVVIDDTDEHGKSSCLMISFFTAWWNLIIHTTFCGTFTNNNNSNSSSLVSRHPVPDLTLKKRGQPLWVEPWVGFPNGATTAVGCPEAWFSICPSVHNATYTKSAGRAAHGGA